MPVAVFVFVTFGAFPLPHHKRQSESYLFFELNVNLIIPKNGLTLLKEEPLSDWSRPLELNLTMAELLLSLIISPSLAVEFTAIYLEAVDERV